MGIRIGVLISGGGTNLQAILDACQDGRIDGQVVFVGSDVSGVRGLERAEKAGVPTFVVDYSETRKKYFANPGEFRWCRPNDSEIGKVFYEKYFSTKAHNIRAFGGFVNFAWRMTFEKLMLMQLNEHQIDLLVLAGFMRVLSPYFIDQMNQDQDKPRIMNIHPALLPAFPGTDGYGDTFRYGCKVGGCTVHFVDYGEDTGPIIGQRAVPNLPDDTLENFKKKGLLQEWELYPECIQLFAEGRLKVVELENGRRVVDIMPK